mmetsp:Transcript_33393/g.93722  ORF Transcript_33393/g.93722 Transcript_33393/m.93722 type:complete len:105 (+) Transcript_33393:407-721(+)
MQTQVRELLRELGLKLDPRKIAITPGSLRRSARIAARRSGLLDEELDAIGLWKPKTVGNKHYDDFLVPEDLSDTILQTDAFTEVWPQYSSSPAQLAPDPPALLE